jgi:HEPN domain-containing protein
MKKAAGDEAILARLIEDADIPDDALGFHAQQAVEKMIKAVLAWHEVPYERTHNIAYLVTLLEGAPDIAVPPNGEELPTLTPWAAEFRYDDLPDAGLDRRETLSVVEEIKAWAVAELVKPESEPEPEPEP